VRPGAHAEPVNAVLKQGVSGVVNFAVLPDLFRVHVGVAAGLAFCETFVLELPRPVNALADRFRAFAAGLVGELPKEIEAFFFMSLNFP
jgi:hypothetical protein